MLPGLCSATGWNWHKAFPSAEIVSYLFEKKKTTKKIIEVERKKEKERGREGDR